jgi:hypothetical protein
MMLRRLVHSALCVASLILLIRTPALAKDAKPQSLISADCIAVFGFDGLELHRAAFDRTALGQLLKSDLGPLAADLGRRLLGAMGPDVVAARLLAGGPPDELVALRADAEKLPLLFEALSQRGFLAGVELAEGLLPGVKVTIVFPDGGSDQNRPAIQSTVRLIARLAELQLSEKTHAGRSILEGTFFGVGRLACWQEGDHMVVTIGTIGPEPTITLADGNGKSLSDDSSWTELSAFKEYETYARGRIDTARIQRIVNKWVPPTTPILAQLGFDGVSSVSFHLGFEEEYQRATVVFSTASQRRGLLKLLADGESLDLQRLPPLPPDASSIWTLQMQPDAAYRYGIETIEKIITTTDPDELETFHRDIAEFESVLGGNAMKQALATLGPTLVVFNEPGGSIPFFGGTLAVEVKDPKALEEALATILSSLEQVSRNSFTLLRRDYREARVYVFQSKEEFFPFHPTLAVCDGWFYVGVTSQSVHGAIYRARETAKALELSGDLRKKVEELVTHQRKVLAITHTDPRPSIQTLTNLLPLYSRIFGLNNDDGFFRRLDPTLIPNSQVIAGALSPNFTILTDNGQAMRFDAYATLPMPLDFSTFTSVFAFGGF